MILLASCGKDKDGAEPIPNPTDLEFFNANFEDFTTAQDAGSCTTFRLNYFNKILDFANLKTNEVGTVSFNSDGTCTNHWEGNQSFVSWRNYVIDATASGGEYHEFCNFIYVTMIDIDTGEEEEVLMEFQKFYDDRVEAWLVSTSTRIIFYPT